MYLLITEDGHIYKSYEITEADKVAVKEGLLDIIAIGDTQPVQWFNDTWHHLEWTEWER